MCAVRALDSARKPPRIDWIWRKSSSRNDQLEAPLNGSASCDGGFHPADDRLGPPAQHRLALPRQIIPEEPDRLDAVLAGQEAESGKASQRSGTEEVPPMIGESPLGQQPAGRCTEQHTSGKDPAARSHQLTSWRATSAWARVTPSTYSR